MGKMIASRRAGGHVPEERRLSRVRTFSILFRSFFDVFGASRIENRRKGNGAEGKEFDGCWVCWSGNALSSLYLIVLRLYRIQLEQQQLNLLNMLIKSETQSAILTFLS